MERKRKSSCEFFYYPLTEEEKVSEEVKRGWTPLHYAVIRNELHCVKDLLGRGGQADIQDIKGKAPLHYAAELNLTDIMEEMLKTNPNLNIQDNEGKTPMNTACEYKKHDVAKCLLEAGANYALSNNEGMTPLHYTALKNCVEIAENIINLNIRNNERKTMLMHHKKIKTCLDDSSTSSYVIEYFKRERERIRREKELSLLLPDVINMKDQGGQTPLLLACRRRHSEMAECLLEAGADYLLPDNYGITPLDYCNDVFMLEVAQKMIIGGNPSIDTQDYEGKTLMHTACIASNRELVSSLIKEGACVFIHDKCGKLPIHHAASSESLDILQEVIKRMHHLNKIDNEGNTPLHIACQCRNVEGIECLLRAGATVDIKNSEGYNALYFFPDVEYLQICNTFGTKKWSSEKVLNMEDCCGYTPLELTIKQWSIDESDEDKDEYLKVIQFLVDNGVYFRKKDCESIDEFPILRSNLFTNIKLCVKSISNRYNYETLHNLNVFFSTFHEIRITGQTTLKIPTIYRVPTPSYIRKLEVNKNQMKKIEGAVEVEIKSQGYCDVSSFVSPSLAMLAAEVFASQLKLYNPLRDAV